MKFTIIGSKGFIGSNLVDYFKKNEIEYSEIDINDKRIFSEKLGHVIYAIGMTSDFRNNTFNTIKSHVCILNELLNTVKFDSFLYLSSARIYYGQKNTQEENSININSIDPDKLYNISKIMGESICFSSNKDNVRVVRLSNVIGKDFSSNNFIFSLIKDAIKKNEINLNTSLESEKDYINIKDVVKILPEISINGKEKLYNIASGKNIKTEKIVEIINNKLGNQVKINHTTKKIIFPCISIQKIMDEFRFESTSVLDMLPNLINEFNTFIRKK